MSFHQILARLRLAVTVEYRGIRDGFAVIDKRDLKALLEDYDRIDAAYRDLYSRAKNGRL